LPHPNYSIPPKKIAGNLSYRKFSLKLYMPYKPVFSVVSVDKDDLVSFISIVCPFRLFRI
ncbi:hypothetical protein, partial [Zooshikella harenae]